MAWAKLLVFCGFTLRAASGQATKMPIEKPAIFQARETGKGDVGQQELPERRGNPRERQSKGRPDSVFNSG